MPISDRFKNLYSKILNDGSATGAIPLSHVMEGAGFDGGSEDNAANSEYLKYMLGRNNHVYLEMLRDWDYKNTLVNVFKEPIIEILSTLQNINLTVKGQFASKTDYVVNKLSELDIIRYIRENLDDFIYKGGMFSFLHHDKSNDVFKFLRANSKSKILRVSKFREPISYSIEGTEDSNFVVSIEKGVWCGYKAKLVRTENLLSYLKGLKDGPVKEQVLESLKSDSSFDFLSDKVLESIDAIEYDRWTSNFENQAYLMFKIWLYELILQLLTSKDSIKQDILVATFAEQGRKVPNIAKILQKIEDVCNASSNISTIEDPYSMIDGMLASFNSSIRVLPTTQETANFTKLDLGDSSNKRAQLAQEIADMKDQLLGSLKIPPEMLMTGQASRWDILSRSDGFMTEVTTYLNAISYFVRSAAAAILMSNGARVSINDIEFNIMNSTGVQSQLSRTKVLNFNEEVQTTAMALQNVQAIMSSPFYDPVKVVDELINRSVRDGLPFNNAFYDRDELLQRLAGEYSPNNVMGEVNNDH